jgi:hypothetical protein
MITCAQFIPAALDEAAAIVEAEWMRLQQQGAARVGDRARTSGRPINSKANIGGDALSRIHTSVSNSLCEKALGA